MASVTHGKPGNFSRPRELLQKRTKERLLVTAKYLGFSDLHPRVTKDELIEMVTTDGALPEEEEEEEEELRGRAEEEDTE